MTDTLSKADRSKNMSHIRSTGNRPEEKVRRYLFSCGLRYRKNVRTLPGCPDIVLKKYRTVVMVNGCFWHHHDCGRFVWPETNAGFWRKKIERSVERDRDNRRKLEELGWRVIVVWECRLKKRLAEETLEALYDEITKDREG